MLSTLSHMSTQEADECKNCADASTQAFKTYYQGILQHTIGRGSTVYPK